MYKIYVAAIVTTMTPRFWPDKILTRHESQN